MPAIARGQYLTGMVISVAVLLFYIPALNNGFVNFDDPYYVINNGKLEISSWASTWQLMFDPEAMSWHPLTSLSFALDYTIWQLDPFGYHLTNVILHSLNSFCVYILTLKLLRSAQINFSNRQLIISATLTTILFALHPLRVESVVWVTERKDVLYALFFLLSVITYLNYVKAAAGQRSKHYLTLCLLFSLALMSKAMAVTLPALLLILDIYPLQRIPSMRLLWSRFIEKAPLFILSAGSTLISLQMQTSSGALKQLTLIPLWDRIVNAIYAYLFYLNKLFVPIDLVPFYPHPTLSQYSIPNFVYLTSGVIFLVLSMVSVYRWSTGKPLSAVVWGSYVLMTLPVIGLIQIGGHSAADRFTYLPMVGICIVIAVGLVALLEHKTWRRFLSMGLIVLLLPLMLLQTQRQIGIWQDSGHLWDHQLAIYPMADALPYFNRGLWYETQPQGLSLAIADYTNAIRLQSRHLDAIGNRGILFAQTGNTAAAMADFNRAIQLAPEQASTYVNRGTLYHQLGDLIRAAEDYQQALGIDPRHRVALYNLGLIQQ